MTDEIRRLARACAKLAHEGTEHRWLVQVETALLAYADHQEDVARLSDAIHPNRHAASDMEWSVANLALLAVAHRCDSDMVDQCETEGSPAGYTSWNLPLASVRRAQQLTEAKRQVDEAGVALAKTQLSIAKMLAELQRRISAHTQTLARFPYSTTCCRCELSVLVSLRAAFEGIVS